MLKPILRYFEIEYPEGYQFWDKAGRVACDLAQAMPGLWPRNAQMDQKDFVLPDNGGDLFYGIRAAMLRSFAEDGSEFRTRADLLTEILTEELELKAFTRFQFHLVLGWPCNTLEDAAELAMKLLPPEVGQTVKSSEFLAAQLEVRKGSGTVTERFATLDAAPPATQTPHFAHIVRYDIFEPIAAAGFKPSTQLESMESRVAADVTKRIQEAHTVGVVKAPPDWRTSRRSREAGWPADLRCGSVSRLIVCERSQRAERGTQARKER